MYLNLKYFKENPAVRVTTLEDYKNFIITNRLLDKKDPQPYEYFSEQEFFPHGCYKVFGKVKLPVLFGKGSIKIFIAVGGELVGKQIHQNEIYNIITGETSHVLPISLYLKSLQDIIPEETCNTLEEFMKDIKKPHYILEYNNMCEKTNDIHL